MQAQEIEHYQAELGAALQDEGNSKAVRLLLIGCMTCPALPYWKSIRQKP